MTKSSVGILICMLNISFSAVALEKVVNLSVYIAKDISSPGISIEAEHDNYLALYEPDSLTFNDVHVNVKVSAPLTSPSNYDIVLKDMVNHCDGVAVDNVDSNLDGVEFPEGDIQRESFQNNNGNEQWTDHLFTLSFPNIPQKSLIQNCTGQVALKVEAII